MIWVVEDRKLRLDSVTATQFLIRVVLAHELDEEQFREIYEEMAYGFWDEGKSME